MSNIEIPTLLFTFLLSCAAVVLAWIGGHMIKPPRGERFAFNAILIQYAMLAILTFYSFYQLSLKNPYFGYGWYVTGLFVWYTVLLFLFQPLVMRYNQKKNDYWAS